MALGADLSNILIYYYTGDNAKELRLFDFSYSEHFTRLPTMVRGITSAQHGRTPLAHGSFTLTASFLTVAIVYQQDMRLATMAFLSLARIKMIMGMVLSRCRALMARFTM